MDFKDFYRQLTPAQRDDLAAQVHTTSGYLHQIAYGKHIELGLADAIVAVAPKFKQELNLADLPLTDRAKTQDSVRKQWSGQDRRRSA